MDLTEKKHRSQTVEIRHPWESARLKIVSNLLSQEVSPSEIKHVLDIGCGDIFVAKSLTKVFPNATFHCADIEFTDELIEQFKAEVGDLPIHLYKNYTDVNLGADHADIVLLLDVIEHIEDDIEFMKGLRQTRLINDKTKVLITVPAFQQLFCAHDEFLGHYRRYTNQMLESHLNQAGYKKLRLGYFFTTLLLPRYLEVRKEKSQGKKDYSTGLVNWNKGKMVTSVISGILYLDYLIFSKLFRVQGLSNYIVCQKIG